MELWSEIERASRSIDGWVDHEAHHETLLALRGGLADDPPERELDDASWSLYVRNVPEAREAGDAAEPIDDAAAAAVAACIHGMATDSLAWLAALRADLPDPRREAEARAFEPRAGDASLLRYEAHLSRQFHRSLGSLIELTKSGDDLVVATEEDAPNEPNLPAESVDNEGVASDPEIAETAPEERPVAAASPVPPACDASAAPSVEDAPRPATDSVRGGGEARALPSRSAGEGASSGAVAGASGRSRQARAIRPPRRIGPVSLHLFTASQSPWTDPCHTGLA